MEDFKKFTIAITNLKPDTQYVYKGDTPTTEELFNEVEWVIGIKQNGTATLTKTNPHPELTWSAVNAEMDRLQAEYEAQEYARNRQVEYPATTEFLEAYTEKEIGGDSTKWDAYVVKYNKVRSDVPKP